MDSFLHMGGYAFYVWTSYALAVVILALNWIAPQRALRARWQSLLRRARPQATIMEVSGMKVADIEVADIEVSGKEVSA